MSRTSAPQLWRDLHHHPRSRSAWVISDAHCVKSVRGAVMIPLAPAYGQTRSVAFLYRHAPSTLLHLYITLTLAPDSPLIKPEIPVMGVAYANAFCQSSTL